MSLRNVGRGVSGLVLGASLLVHLLTFVPSVAINMDFVWPLHVGAMASFLVMFVGLIHVQSALRKSTPQADSPSSRLEMRREFNRRVEWAPSEPDELGLTPPPLVRAYLDDAWVHIPLGLHLLRWCIMPLQPGEVVPPLSDWVLDQFGQR